MERGTLIYLTALTLLLASSAASEGWPQFMHDAQHTSALNTQTPRGLRSFEERWAYQTKAWLRSPPVAADIDGDGMLDIVFGADDGILRVIDANGTLKWEYPADGKIRASPLVADVTGDGSVDIVFATQNGSLYALNGRGLMQWRRKIGAPIDSSPAAGELSVEPGLEVVFGSSDENVYAVSASGKMLWTYKTAEPVHSSPALADIDGDGKLEVLVGSNDNILYALKSPPVKVWMYQTGGDITGSPSVSDIDSDGIKEVIVGSQDGRVYAIYEKLKEIIKGPRRCTPDGCTRPDIAVTQFAEKWNWTTDDAISASPALADLDGDGNKEIMIGSEDRSLYILNEAGKKKKRFTVNKPITEPAAVADLDGDGFPEIAFVTPEGDLFVLNRSGERVWNTKLDAPVHAPPAVADLEGDGMPEIIVAADDGAVHVFENTYSQQIRSAFERYTSALASYENGSKDTALVLAQQAMLLFEGSGYDYGIGLVDDFLARVDADEFMSKANDSYSRGEFENASYFLRQAVERYTELGLNEGLDKAERFFARIDADSSLYEGMLALQSKNLAKAKERLEESVELYEFLEDAAGAAKARKLLEEQNVEFEVSVNQSMQKLLADTAYTRAWSSFYLRNLADAANYGNISERLYAELGDDTGAAKSMTLLKHAEADLEFEQATALSLRGGYEGALESAQQALALYREINYSIGILKAEKTIEKTQALAEAESLYEDSLKYLNLERYGISAALAQDALQSFEKAGDARGVERAQLILDETGEKNRERTESRIKVLTAGLIVFCAVGATVLLRRWRPHLRIVKRLQAFARRIKPRTPRLHIPQVKTPKIRLPRIQMPSIIKKPAKPPETAFTSVEEKAPALTQTPKQGAAVSKQMTQDTHTTQKTAKPVGAAITKVEDQQTQNIKAPEHEKPSLRETPTPEAREGESVGESASGRASRIRLLQEKTRLGHPNPASHAHDLFLLLVRLHELKIAESIRVEDAVDVLNVSPQTLVRWIRGLKERDSVRLVKTGDEFLLTLSDSVLEEERTRLHRKKSLRDGVDLT